MTRQDILKRLLSKNALATMARRIGVPLGPHAARRIRQWIELGLLPPRLAIHNYKEHKKDWMFPGHAELALLAIREVRHLPVEKIQQIVVPLVEQWGREREALLALEASGGLGGFGMPELTAMASLQASDWKKIIAMAKDAGLEHARLDDLVRIIKMGRPARPRDLTDLILLLRCAAAVVGKDPHQQSRIAVAVRSLEYALWAEQFDGETSGDGR